MEQKCEGLLGYFTTKSLEPGENRLLSRSAPNEGCLFRGSLVERPKPGGYKATFCNEEELRTVIAAVNGDPVEFAVITAAFYGLRRSEIVGLKWDAINFQKKTITIRHVVTQTMVEGKHTVIQKDRTKNKTSHRSLPLVAPFEALLLDMKRQQKENQILCGNCYNTDYLDYIYVDPIGNLIKPDYITGHFQLVLKKNGLRRIRFHDLRHPYVKPKTKKYREPLNKQPSFVAERESSRFSLGSNNSVRK